jgi:hypothetical protein
MQLLCRGSGGRRRSGDGIRGGLSSSRTYRARERPRQTAAILAFWCRLCESRATHDAARGSRRNYWPLPRRSQAGICRSPPVGAADFPAPSWGLWREAQLRCLEMRNFQPAGWRKWEENTFILDLAKPLSEIRKDFNGKWRGHLSKAQRSNIEVTRSAALEDFDRFEPLFLSLVQEERILCRSGRLLISSGSKQGAAL